MKMKYTTQQIYQITAAVLFLIGAIFMLVSTFGGYTWSFGVGGGFALLATVFYVLMFFENKKNLSKKLTDPSYSDNKNNMMEHEKTEISEIETAKDKKTKTAG